MKIDGDRCSRNMRKRRSRQPAMPGISRLYLVSQWLQSFPARPFIGRQAVFWGDWTQECPGDGEEVRAAGVASERSQGSGVVGR